MQFISILSHHSGKIHSSPDKWKISWRFWAINADNWFTLWSHIILKVIPLTCLNGPSVAVRNGLSLYCCTQRYAVAEITLIWLEKLQFLDEHWGIKEHCAWPSVASRYINLIIIYRLLQASEGCNWIILIVVQLPAAACMNGILRDLKLERKPSWDEIVVTTDIKENNVGTRFWQGRGIHGIKKKKTISLVLLHWYFLRCPLSPTV